MRSALQKLRPDAKIKSWHIGVAAETESDIAAQLGEYDLIVSQIRGADPSALLSLQRLQETHQNVLYVPTFVFNGFQPDCVYIRIRNKLCEGPISNLHSAIIAACYVMGIPKDRVSRLFNSLTYRSLAYFDAFDIGRDLILHNFATAGFDLSPYFPEWIRTSGSFMHTVNHPHICVLVRLAHLVAVRAELVDETTALPKDVEDALGKVFQWPVYSEIARRLALPSGSMLFRRADREIDLQTFIAGSYKKYHDFDRSELRTALPRRVMDGIESVLAT
jgi:hypothetical protein